ncbi:MAG: O-antigen ligase family protein [Actinobacteria bacterium]|nr:O-antigen ligase family protein [Actinomycetota bacterium]
MNTFGPRGGSLTAILGEPTRGGQGAAWRPDMLLRHGGGTALAALGAAALAVATLRYGPVALVPLGALFAVALSGYRRRLTAWLLPLCLLPHGMLAGSLYVSVSDVLAVVLGAPLLLDRAMGRHDRALLGALGFPAIAFVIWTAASALWAADPAAPLIEATQRFTFVILGTALAASLPSDGRLLRRSLVLLVMGSAALAMIVVVTGIAEGRLMSVYAAGMHKNALGYLLSYGVVTGVALLWHRPTAGSHWLGAATALAGAGLVVSGSRGAWVGAVVAVGLMSALHRPQWRWFAVTAAAVGATLLLTILPPAQLGALAKVDVANSTADVRIQTWTQGLDAAASRPLLGAGAGNFTADVRSQGSQVDPNNVLLLAAAETGIPGALLLLAIFVTGFALAARTLGAASAPPDARVAALAGVGIAAAGFVHAQFDMFWTRSLALATFIGIGLTLWSQTSMQSNKSDRELTKMQATS